MPRATDALNAIAHRSSPEPRVDETLVGAAIVPVKDSPSRRGSAVVVAAAAITAFVGSNLGVTACTTGNPVDTLA